MHKTLIDPEMDIDIKEGTKLGQFTVLVADDKEATVECSCGSINTYTLTYLRTSQSPRQCFNCVKKNREQFNITNKPKGSKKYPTLDEDVSKAMIAKFIKEKK